MIARPSASLSALRRALARDVAGGVGVIAALALPVMLGGAGLAYDVNLGLAQHVLDQRAADLAALGAATAYKASQSSALLQPTAHDVVVANGLAAATVTASLVSDYPGKGDSAVKVTVSTSVPYTLGRLLGAAASYTVSATAYASLSAAPPYAPPCLLALSSAGDALTTSGGASISTPTCSVAAVGSIDNEGAAIAAHDIIAGGGDITNGSGSLAAQSLRYAGSFINPSWNSSVPGSDKRFNLSTPLPDPWAASRDLAQARALLGVYTAVPALTNPSTYYADGQDYAFTYKPSVTMERYRGNGNGTYLMPAGVYHMNRMSVASGITVTFASGSTIYINKGFSNAGASVDFANSNVYVNGGFDTGASGVTIGSGTLWIGSGTVNFAGATSKGDGNVTINATASVAGGAGLTMGAGAHQFGAISIGGGAGVNLGAGGFQANAGVNVAGGGELSLGDGAVLIGPSSNGYAINLAAGARVFMGAGAFSANGAIVTAAGSRLAFGSAGNHLINGAVTIAGSALFGAGRYTINGNLANSTGGTPWPYTSTLTKKTYGDTLEGTSVGGFDMAGVNVTFILAGTVNLGGGAKTRLIAPSNGSTASQLADMLIHSLTAADTAWAAGSSNNFAGTVYLPNSKVTMSGGDTTLSGNQCFTLIASKIAASGGAATGSACPTMVSAYSGVTGGGMSAVRLVK